jgi:hypothetical protein
LFNGATGSSIYTAINGKDGKAKEWCCGLIHVFPGTCLKGFGKQCIISVRTNNLEIGISISIQVQITERAMNRDLL